MKKWLGLYIAICLAVLCVCSGVMGVTTAKQAAFGIVEQEGGYASQVIRAEGHSYVLYQNPEQKKFQIVKTDKKLTDYETVATAHQNGVYQLYRYTEGGRQFFGTEPLGLAKGEEPWQPVVFQQEGEVLAFGSNEKGLCCSVLGEDGRTITEYTLSLENPLEWKERQSYRLPEGHFALCGAYEGDALWIALEDGSVYRKMDILEETKETVGNTILADRLKSSVAEGGLGTWRFYWTRAVVLKLLVPVLLLSAVAVVLLYGSRKRNHLVFRLLCCTELLCCVALLFAGWFLSERLVQQRVLETGVEAGRVLEEIKASQRADGTVSPQVYWTAVEERKGLLEDLIILQPDSGEVLMAKTLPAGAAVDTYYGPEMEALAAEVAAGNQAVMTRLKQADHPSYVVALRDWTDMTPDSVLLAVLTESGIQKGIANQMASLKHLIAALLVLLSLAHIGLFFLFAGRWRKFVKGISYVATENMAYPETPRGNDGLQSAWVPLERIGHNLSRLYYETEKLYRSYYRFVPKDMETLLKKPELADMEIGDRNKIRGCMVHFVLEDMKHLDGADYMEVITKSMELMHGIRKQRQGIYLSGTTDLLERKLFFEQSAQNALQFSIDLLHAYGENELLAEKNLILMLHGADFQYGISGVKDMMTPYMYSAQESILEPYAKPLAKAKVKLVLTEQMVRLVGPGFSLRYIGFVSGGENVGSLKLYECLDAFEEKKRKLMLDTDAIFQKGLQLFYSNDFYLARNTFNEVLKLNEEDHIARWYLFHCEYHLNQTDAEISYGLFENIVLEQEYDKL